MSGNGDSGDDLVEMHDALYFALGRIPRVLLASMYSFVFCLLFLLVSGSTTCDGMVSSVETVHYSSSANERLQELAKASVSQWRQSHPLEGELDCWDVGRIVVKFKCRARTMHCGGRAWT